MKLCVTKCLEKKKACEETSCRQWIDYNKDLNCSRLAVEKNGPMTLQEVAKRLHLSHVRISQVEKEALRKLEKKILEKK
jgi:hypothetical protein